MYLFRVPCTECIHVPGFRNAAPVSRWLAVRGAAMNPFRD
eukprot:COSAG06_NODE_57447_length_280_cov_0.839779_1_plen_39_part_10